MLWCNQERGRNDTANSLASVYHGWYNCVDFDYNRGWTESQVSYPSCFSRRSGKVKFHTSSSAPKPFCIINNATCGFTPTIFCFLMYYWVNKRNKLAKNIMIQNI